MKINNDKDLAQAAERAGVLLQAINDYCVEQGKTIADVPASQVRFPRGFIRTAGHQRNRFKFLSCETLKSNIAYTLMLSDTVLWLAIRTDVSGMARDMLYKLFIFLVATIIESSTKEYLKGICGKNYKTRTTYLVEEGIIDNSLKDELDWLWDIRNKMHLFQLHRREYENEYCPENHERAIFAFRRMLDALSTKGPL